MEKDEKSEKLSQKISFPIKRTSERKHRYKHKLLWRDAEWRQWRSDVTIVLRWEVTLLFLQQLKIVISQILFRDTTVHSMYTKLHTNWSLCTMSGI